MEGVGRGIEAPFLALCRLKFCMVTGDNSAEFLGPKIRFNLGNAAYVCC